MDGFLREVMQKAGIGRFGVCAYDAELCSVPCRAIRKIPPGARSIIVAALPFYAGEYPGRNVARYALGPDYHEIGAAILGDVCGQLAGRFPGETFVPFIDTSPIDEVRAAQRAGIGVIGRNRQLIIPRYGSYIFIGEIVTTLPLPADPPASGSCLNCGRCVSACPTGALDGGFFKERCRSYLTQKKHLDPWEAEQVAMGGMVWGCDICTQACPMNRDAERTPIQAFTQGICDRVTKSNLNGTLPGRAYAYKGPALLLRNLELLEPPRGSGGTRGGPA